MSQDIFPSPENVERLQEPFVFDVIGFSFSLVGLASGIFCLYAVVSGRFYTKFPLVLIHTTSLLIATLCQVFIAPALHYTSNKNNVCHGFKFLELSARVVVNCSSSAMMFWYMLFNKSMYFYNLDKGAIDLRKLYHEALIYFFGCTIIAGGTVFAYFYQVHGSLLIGRMYCFTIAFYHEKAENFLINFCLYGALYAPLFLGMIWFLLGRSKWKLEASEIITGSTENLIAVLHRLFYWLTWSAILTQLPGFIADIFTSKSYFVKVMANITTHLTSIQNTIDAVGFYVILWKPMWNQKFSQKRSFSEYRSSSEIVTATITRTSAELKNANDFSERLLV